MDQVDIAICGAGPVGLALALLLTRQGVAADRIALVDAKSAEQAVADPRSIALSYGSRQILEQLGAWAIPTDAIHQIHVSRRSHFGRTLIDRDAAIVRYAQSIWEACGSEDEDLRAKFVLRFVELDALGFGSKLKMFQLLLSEFPIGKVVDLLLKDFKDRFPASAVAFGDAHSTLAALRRTGFNTGVVTNGSRRSQRKKLEVSGLLPLLDVIVISEEVEVKKPNPRIFEIAMSSLSCRTDEVIFVGDSEELDIKGAKAVGMTALLLKSDGQTCPTIADGVISSLSQVIPFLEAVK